MPYEIVGTKRKRKLYQMPFMRRIDEKPVVRFTNYDKYDRREVLKKFLDASNFRHQLDVEEDMEQLENDPMTSRFLVANQSSYGRAMDHVMKTFATREQELKNVDIRGQSNPKPEVFLENPKSTALLFQDHYKFDQRNSSARELSRYISGKVGSFLKSEQFREKVEREKGKILSGLKKNGKNDNDDDNDDDDDEFDNNDDSVYRDSKGKVIPSFKRREDCTVNNLLEGTYDHNKLWGTDSKKEWQYSSDDEDRKEADNTLNRRFENIESVVNRENRFSGDNKEGIDPKDEPLDEGGCLVFSRGLSDC